jgi:hypothetical protein
LREKHSLRFQSRVVRKTFGVKRVEITGMGGNCVMRSFMIYTAHQTLFG